MKIITSGWFIFTMVHIHRFLSTETIKINNKCWNNHQSIKQLRKCFVRGCFSNVITSLHSPKGPSLKAWSNLDFTWSIVQGWRIGNSPKTLYRCSNSIATTLELLQFCTKPSIYSVGINKLPYGKTNANTVANSKKREKKHPRKPSEEITTEPQNVKIAHDNDSLGLIHFYKGTRGPFLINGNCEKNTDKCWIDHLFIKQLQKCLHVALFNVSTMLFNH